MSDLLQKLRNKKMEIAEIFIEELNLQSDIPLPILVEKMTQLLRDKESECQVLRRGIKLLN